MARPSPYPAELRRRAVRMVAEVRPDYDTEWAAMKAVASNRSQGPTTTLSRANCGAERPCEALSLTNPG